MFGSGGVWGRIGGLVRRKSVIGAVRPVLISHEKDCDPNYAVPVQMKDTFRLRDSLRDRQTI